MESKFPTTIDTNEKIRAVHNAMPSAVEGTILDETVALTELVVGAAVLFMFRFLLNDQDAEKVEVLQSTPCDTEEKVAHHSLFFTDRETNHQEPIFQSTCFGCICNK